MLKDLGSTFEREEMRYVGLFEGFPKSDLGYLRLNKQLRLKQPSFLEQVTLLTGLREKNSYNESCGELCEVSWVSC